MDNLLKSSTYVKFIRDRDRALETIHIKAQHDVSTHLTKMFQDIERAALQIVARTGKSPVFALSYMFDQVTLEIMSKEIYPIVHLIDQMNRTVYEIAYWGEIEAVGRATNSFDPNVSITSQKHNKGDEFEKLRDRVWLALMKLRDQINLRFRFGLVKGKDPDSIVTSVKEVFPEYKVYKQPPRELKPVKKVKEAKSDPVVTTGFTDSSTWDDTIQDYKDSELPESRFETEPEDTTGRYSWDLENEMTDSFVTKVRNGQVEGATQAGIQDFVWVAVLDDKTDECCSTRNGKTTSEIEKGLDDGTLDASLCDATVPPAHFNCATAGHWIKTFQGNKLIETILPGDEVLTHNNRFMPVERCLQSFAHDLIKIILTDGTILTVTEEHSFLIGDQWIEAKNLNAGDWVQKSDICGKESQGSKIHDGEPHAKEFYDSK